MIGGVQLEAKTRNYACAWLIAVALAVLAIVPASKGIVHETDHAALIRGALELSPENIKGLVAYNYDKMFFSYWLLAGAERIARLINAQVDVVAVSNLLSSSMLLSAIAVVLLRYRRRFFGGSVCLVPLLAPAYIVHNPFFSGASLSTAFLLLLFVWLDRAGHRPGIRSAIVALILAFASVGCRADALLAFPLLSWVCYCPSRRPWRMFLHPMLWMLAAGGGGALMLGSLLSSVPPAPLFNLVIQWKVFAAYTVFGLGAAGILLFLMAGAVVMRIIRTQEFGHRLSWIICLGALLLPFVFYVIQLLTTRYWVVGLTSLTMFLVSKRGQGILITNRGVFSRGTSTCLLILAVVPLVLGVRVPAEGTIRATVTRPVAFPSGDGLVPMGAMIAWVLGPFTGLNEVPDHSQALWLALQTAHFQPDETGMVPVLDTALGEIVRLGVWKAGFRSRSIPYVEYHEQPVYAELRSLIRLSGGLNPIGLRDLAEDVLNRSVITDASSLIAGTKIMYIAPKTEQSVGEEEADWRVLKRLFGGDEFGLFPLSQVEDKEQNLAVPLGANRTIVLLSQEHMEVRLIDHESHENTLVSQAVATASRWQFLRLDGNMTNARSIRLLAPKEGNRAQVRVAVAALPDFMSVRKFKKPSPIHIWGMR